MGGSKPFHETTRMLYEQQSGEQHIAQLDLNIIYSQVCMNVYIVLYNILIIPTGCTGICILKYSVAELFFFYDALQLGCNHNLCTMVSG